jgi:hypothetical protein
MLRFLTAPLVFGFTFAASVLLISSLTREKPAAQTDAQVVELTTPAAAYVATTSSNEDMEFSDLPEFDTFLDQITSGKLVDISHRQGLYRESEVVATTGEKWLVLTQRGGRYSLVTALASVRKLRSSSYPGDENDARLTFSNIERPVFAVRDLKSVRPGGVTTLYERPSDREIDRRNLPIDPMKTGFKRDFNLGDDWYTLRVSRGKTAAGTTVGALVLEKDDVHQVIAQNYHDGSGEIIGELRWVGDLDRDGKLDLYFDEFNEKGYYRVSLYLSSAAAAGNLVKRVAEFSTAGC